MLTTPPVNYLWRHLELTVMLATLADERSQIIDKLCGSVVSYMG
jgi:hypothetical protein